MTHPNLLLARLRQCVLDDLLSHASRVELHDGQCLAEARGKISHVYFPHSGTISNVVDLSMGKAIETSLIGRDGVFGAENALDHHLAVNRVMVQVAGTATILTAANIVSLAARYPEFRRLVLAYGQFNYGQVQQTAACNAAHSIRNRLCRWLLRLHELNGAELNFTHDLLSQMMGVRRTSVTEIARKLAALGMISYSRGRLRILDVVRLETQACECHGTVSQSYTRLFPDRSGHHCEIHDLRPS